MRSMPETRWQRKRMVASLASKLLVRHLTYFMPDQELKKVAWEAEKYLPEAGRITFDYQVLRR